MNPTKTICEYVSGKLTLRDFQSRLMNDPELETFLSEDIQLPPYTRCGSLFLYVIGQNPSGLEADVDARDAMSKLLDRLGVDHEVDRSSAAALGLILAAAPKWLDLPDHYASMLVATLPDHALRAEKIRIIKARIAADFVVLGKPPRWLQSAAWPFAGSRPLTFVGQLDIGGLMHDDAQLYVFFDPEDQRFQTMTQMA